MQVLLLAAGLGTRLFPLTADRAKPAVPFMGRPLIAGLAQWALNQGATRLIVNTHHQPESIHAALAGFEKRTELLFSHEPEILGTAGALWKANQAGLFRDAPLLIVNAKLHTTLDLAALLRTHQSQRALVTMALRSNPRREHFREVLTDATHVLGFGPGRVPQSATPLLFTGIHCLEPQVFKGIGPGFSDTVADVYPPLIAQRLVAAHLDDTSAWSEFSTLERYLQLQQDPPAVICSPHAVIEPGAQVARSILWEGARVAAGAIVEDAILGAGVQIRANEVVRYQAVVRLDRVKTAEPEHLWGDRVRMPIAPPIDRGSAP